MAEDSFLPSIFSSFIKHRKQVILKSGKYNWHYGKDCVHN